MAQVNKKGTGKPRHNANQQQNLGKAKLAKRLRDLERSLRRENIPSNVRVDNERAIKAIKVELEEKDAELKAKLILQKYHMVRFFERKKATRKYKQAKKVVTDLESDEKSEKKDLKKAKKVLRHCEIDLAYVVNFPKTEKYVSLYPNASDVKKDDPNVKKGLLETEKKRNSYKRKFEQMLDAGTLPTKIEDVLEGKKTQTYKSDKGSKKAIDAPEERKEETQDEFFE